MINKQICAFLILSLHFSGLAMMSAESDEKGKWRPPGLTIVNSQFNLDDHSNSKNVDTPEQRRLVYVPQRLTRKLDELSPCQLQQRLATIEKERKRVVAGGSDVKNQKELLEMYNAAQHKIKDALCKFGSLDSTDLDDE